MLCLRIPHVAGGLVERVLHPATALAVLKLVDPKQGLKTLKCPGCDAPADRADVIDVPQMQEGFDGKIAVRCCIRCACGREDEAGFTVTLSDELFESVRQIRGPTSRS